MRCVTRVRHVSEALENESMSGTWGGIARKVAVRLNLLSDTAATGQGLTLVHFSAQLEPFLTQTHPDHPPIPSKHPLNTS